MVPSAQCSDHGPRAGQYSVAIPAHTSHPWIELAMYSVHYYIISKGEVTKITMHVQLSSFFFFFGKHVQLSQLCKSYFLGEKRHSFKIILNNKVIKVFFFPKAFNGICFFTIKEYMLCWTLAMPTNVLRQLSKLKESAFITGFRY